MFKRWNSRVRSIGRGPSYIRFTPNPGFSIRFGFGKRWLHFCRACGWTLLGAGESRRAVRPKRS
jgi:hypothetical protein